jgi:hypothetical protein
MPEANRGKSVKTIGEILPGIIHKFEAVNEQFVSKMMAQDEFIHKQNCGCGHPIHTFHVPGEQLEGRLRPCKDYDRADRAKTAEIYYLNSQGVEQCCAIRLTKWLWRTVLEHHLFGCYVRITYKGAVRGKLRYSEKIFLVEVDKGAITEKFEAVENIEPKPRKPRKYHIRRPEPVVAQED